MRDNLEEIESLGTKIIAISVDSPEDAKELAEKLNLTFPLLSDPRRLVISDYNASDTAMKNDVIIAKSLNVYIKKGGEMVYRHTSDWAHRTPVGKLMELFKEHKI